MKYICFTSDKGNWALKGFAHQWDKYFGEQVEVVGFTETEIMSHNFTFTSLGKFEDYPANRWSNAAIKYLSSINDELVAIFLEDYWLIRPVNFRALKVAEFFTESTPDAGRFCLTADRMYTRGVRDVAYANEIDIILAEKNAEYNLSLQASIWRRSALLELLVPDETPWEFELYGTERLNISSWRVYGTRQWPVKYSIVVNKGQLDKSGEWMFPPRTLLPTDWQELEELGYV